MIVTASAPAKVILFGEHFVVYNEPAIVIAIDRRAYASAELRKDQCICISSKNLETTRYFSKAQLKGEKNNKKEHSRLEPIRIAVQKVLDLSEIETGVNINVNSSIPIAAGLGSSAAVTVATTAALGELLNLKLSQKTIFQITFEAESFVHGTPSGIDPTISIHGGIILYYKDKGFSPLNFKNNLQLVIGDSGVKRSTGEMVAAMRKLKTRYNSIINLIIKSGGNIASRAIEALKKEDFKTVGELMNINHSLLSAVGVSNKILDKLVYAARKAGAYGAKLTGAGGGGCIIALAPSHKLKEVVDSIRKEGGSVFIARKTNEGVKIDR
jgi:mevalonate kinase